jgi:hypothetical protein
VVAVEDILRKVTKAEEEVLAVIVIQLLVKLLVEVRLLKHD